MELNKVIRSSRAFPLGCYDLWLLPGEWEVFVKRCENFNDVLAISTVKKYICRYQFPKCFDNMYIYNFFKYGTVSETRSRSLQDDEQTSQE